MRNYLPEIAILDGAIATGDGVSIKVHDFIDKILTIATDGMGAGDTILVKVKGSTQLDVDFSAAKSITNRWDYVQIVDLEDGSTVDGDTGVSITESDDLRQFAINIDGLAILTAEVVTISDVVNTSVSAYLQMYNN